MNDLECAAYGPVLGPLIAEAPLAELGAGRATESARAQLDALSIATSFAPARVVDREMAQGCLAGLWLMYDFLDASHTISQSLENPSGSYWHAIMHRREGDFGNSKYWFRQVGSHPIFAILQADAAKLAVAAPSAAAASPLVPGGRGDRGERESTVRSDARSDAIRTLAEQSHWDPYRFVDLCAAAVTNRSNAAEFCRAVQLQECRRLFDHCYRQAVGQPG